MPSELELELDRLRRRIKIARTVERTVRWTFYATLALSLCLAVLKILAYGGAVGASWSVGPGPALALVAAVAASALAMESARRFSRFDCAVLLDRRLNLEERLSTSLVAEGPMAEALRRDAAREWKSADSRRVLPRLPREAAGLLGAAIFLAALLLVPQPEARRAALDPELAASARGEAARLRETGDAQLTEVADQLEEARTVEDLAAALARLRLIEVDSDGSGAGETAAAAAASGTALSSALARRGALPEALAAAPPLLDRKLRLNATGVEGGRHASSRGGDDVSAPESKLGGPARVTPGAAASGAPARRAWDPEYDEIVATYFREIMK